jgi:hypothetical protein
VYVIGIGVVRLEKRSCVVLLSGAPRFGGGGADDDEVFGELRDCF